MLTVQNLTKSYGIEPILAEISFTVNPAERVGLIGPNGCGKTTLLRCIHGSEQPDSGVIRFNPSNLIPGYLPQGADFLPDETLAGFIRRYGGDAAALADQVELLAAELAKNPEQIGLQAEFDRVLSQLSAAGESFGRMPQVLSALGLDRLPPDLPVAALSGGQKTRLALAGILLNNPPLLLLDEPTNHLDVEMLMWLENWLCAFNGAVLIVSHDRTFLDRVATTILEIDGNTHHGRVFAGNYSGYLEQKLAERSRQWDAYHDQQIEIQRLRAAAGEARDRAQFRKGGKGDPANGDKFAAAYFANRSRRTMHTAKSLEKRVQELLTTDAIEKPVRSWEMKMHFSSQQESGRDVIVLENVAVGYGDLVLLNNLNLTLRYGNRTAVVGPNGCGKTTLLRTITGWIEPLAGKVRLGSGVRLGVMAQEQENLTMKLNALETIQRITGQGDTEVRSFLSQFLFKGDDIFTPARLLSFGERARLSLALLVAQGCNLLILDEPINHLDIPARTRFEEALANFKGTILAVVHDRYFLRGFARELWQVKENGIQQIDLTIGEFPDL